MFAAKKEKNQKNILEIFGKKKSGFAKSKVTPCAQKFSVSLFFEDDGSVTASLETSLRFVASNRKGLQKNFLLCPQKILNFWK